MTGADDRLAEPREAFSLLGHDLRLEILLAMLDHWEAANTEPQRFSDLMRAVDLRDSGKFNYHLDRLRGAYLRKADGGYVPTASATALYRAVLAHQPTEPPPRSELAPGVDCPDCGAALTATYERSFLTLRCPDCEGVVGGFTYPLPKNALEGRSDATVVRSVYDRARSEVGLARRGQCPDCAGRTAVAVTPDAADADGDQPVEIGCDTCTWTVRTGLLLPLLSAPRVASALTELGVPVAEAYPWELPTPELSVAGNAPARYELRVETDAGTATVAVDDDLAVLSTAVSVRDEDGAEDDADAGAEDDADAGDD